MLRAYTYVEGASLAGLILEARRQFWARPPYEVDLDDFRRPNSLRQVAIGVFDDLAPHERLAVVRDLLEANGGLTLGHRPEELFGSADTPADYITDVVCAVVEDVLMRDPGVAAENEHRLEVAAKSLKALRERWRQLE